MAAFSKLGQFGSLGDVVCGVAYGMQVDGLRTVLSSAWRAL